MSIVETAIMYTFLSTDISNYKAGSSISFLNYTNYKHKTVKKDLIPYFASSLKKGSSG